MCSVSGLRSLLCEVVFRPAGPKLRAAGRRQGTGLDGGRKAESGLALVQWLSSPVEGAESCSLQALQLLNELLEVRQTPTPQRFESAGVEQQHGVDCGLSRLK